LKTFAPVLLAAAFSIFSSCAAAPQKAVEKAVYDLPELSMRVSLPPEFLVITRDTVQGREALEEREIDIAAFQRDFVPAGIYLNAMPEDFLSEYVITSHKTAGSQEVGDFARYSDAELNGISAPEALAKDFALGGTSASAGPLVRLNGKVFYTIDFAQTREDGSLVYSRQFFTIVNGIAVNIIYNKYGGPISAEDAERCGKFVEDIVFSEAKP
jgi:hypothetical protein